MNHRSDLTDDAPASNSDSTSDEIARYARKHIRVGWQSILVFSTLGIVLESFHALKLGWYLDVDQEVHRLMWTLAHAHGTLLGFLHVLFAVTLSIGNLSRVNGIAVASNCLTASGVLLPAGFFLGGLFSEGGDPGLGILLVPAGAVFLLIGISFTVVRWAR